MNSIVLKNYNIHFQTEAYLALNQYISTEAFSKIIILVDSNTHQYCLSSFLGELEQTNAVEIIEVDSGEAHKSIDTCSQIWQSLADLNIDRKAIMINLGGGIVTDLGGFVASCFKRGISFVHIPTTLLGMVDAAIGGKNGVNLGALKNQIGVINPPEMVLIDPSFLATLSQAEMRSGLAEMIKHGLIADQNYLDNFKDLSQFTTEHLTHLIRGSIDIKTTISENDPTEKGLRKALNFGHTLGHAIESYSMNTQNLPKLLHGEAVAIGMILALYISTEICGFSKYDCDDYSNLIRRYFKSVEFNSNDIKQIKSLLIHDKKNTNGQINFVLLSKIGKPQLDCQVSDRLIDKAFAYYQS
ncbi:3-dehydroquinate synthase [Psychroflexus sp. ALD_RP9]|uniref:3-dehydroquinate synthase n=1 Tax=Psychroflexus sp. ALD_RP9 TaxID=2777186 RepID=UPI001A90138C|nr:3-dehydroquinate synthase [Psychroflexus sp. ALD_RP9]QSS97425.1 3-dehydroquinate synthase [Psychroflexus sp. ALD_RP9]